MLGTMGVEAQISDAIRGLFKVAGDSAVVADSVRTDIGATGQDSALVVQLRRSLEEARSNEDSLRREFEEAKLNEANLRMEFEQFKLNILAGDSIKRQRQMSFIDSLRKTTKGSPVMVDGDTLFNLYTKKGGQSAMQRAQETGELMELIGKRINLDPGKVYVENTDIFSDIMYGTEVLVSFTDADAMWEGMSRDSLVADRKQVVVDKFQQMKRQYGIWRMVKRVLYCLLVLIVQYLLYRLTCWGFAKLEKKVLDIKDTKLKPIKIQSYEILDTGQQVKLLLVACRVAKWVMVVLQLLISLPIIFGIFPSTKGFHCNCSTTSSYPSGRLSSGSSGIYLTSSASS